MARLLNDWLKAYVDYASFGEAPARMNFWAGISAVAGALRGKVWLDFPYFQWKPNLYIVFVAPPGIVAKSTTTDTAMSLLRAVPKIRFGPAVVTWQALVTHFAEARERFEWRGELLDMSPITINSSEFGNLLDPRDRAMVDMLVHLWDGKPFTKATKNSGTDEVVNPWINIIACTTPDWIAGNLPEYMVGGGFTSRCLFVYAAEKERYVPYPTVPADFAATRAALIADLTHISESLVGEYALTREAIDWGAAWYERHFKEEAKLMDSARFGGYIARKQTLAHKVAMILAASRSDDLVIEKTDLETAVSMLSDLEPDMRFVFEKIGMTADALQSERLSDLVKQRGRLTYAEVYAWAKRYFPHKTVIEDIIAAGINAGQYHFSPGPPAELVAGQR
jgi:hypothetical protein